MSQKNINTDETLKGANLIVAYSLEIDCPYCNAELDLSDHDKNRCFSGPIFNNRSDDLVGETVNCPDCEKEFIIENVGF
ncbi:MAG TPA: hypothetical protein EYG88_08750 [Desulfocapsa sulfexigens]|nr:hypothetical protein [Desulfocapsa sulfexigens]